ncbi:hypothetical protein [Streptomyces sp. NPDC057718]
MTLETTVVLVPTLAILVTGAAADFLMLYQRRISEYGRVWEEPAALY